jgi:voltage-gated potassium channel
VTRKHYDELTPAARKRLVVASLLRAGASVTVLVLVYYTIPLDRPLNAATWIGFGLGLLAFAAVIAWQVRAILASDVPRLRAVQAVAVGLPLLLLLFASTYLRISRASPDSFSEALGRTDALYFTVTVFATVGFGDIAPRSELARILTMIQMITGLVVVGVVAKILLGAVQVAVRRRESDGPATAVAPDGRKPDATDPASDAARVDEVDDPAREGPCAEGRWPAAYPDSHPSRVMPCAVTADSLVVDQQGSRRTGDKGETPMTASTEATRSAHPERPGLTDGVCGEFTVFVKIKPGHADALRETLKQGQAADTRQAQRQIGTLHDARSLIFDDDTRFMFASVFDGSWDTYIDDFATTVIGEIFDRLFSHTEGFPGIKDPNVKEWFVAHQVPAIHFKSSYPDLTTQQIWKDQEVNKAFQEVLDSPEFRAALDNPANAALVATPAFQKLLDKAAG